MKLKFIFLLEMPSHVLGTKRIEINKELKELSYFQPKRNVFLMEVDSENVIEGIKTWVIKKSSIRSKVYYYRIVD